MRQHDGKKYNITNISLTHISQNISDTDSIALYWTLFYMAIIKQP